MGCVDELAHGALDHPRLLHLLQPPSPRRGDCAVHHQPHRLFENRLHVELEVHPLAPLVEDETLGAVKLLGDVLEENTSALHLHVLHLDPGGEGGGGGSHRKSRNSAVELLPHVHNLVHVFDPSVERTPERPVLHLRDGVRELAVQFLGFLGHLHPLAPGLTLDGVGVKDEGFGDEVTVFPAPDHHRFPPVPRGILRLARERHRSLGHEPADVHRIVHVVFPLLEKLSLGSADEELRRFTHRLFVHDVALKRDESAAGGGGEEEPDGPRGRGACVVGLVDNLLPLGKGAEDLPLRHFLQHLGDELAVVPRLFDHSAPALKGGDHVPLGETHDSLLELLAHVLGLLDHGAPALEGAGDRPVAKPADHRRHLLLHLERLGGVIFPSIERDGGFAEDDLAKDPVAEVLDTLDLLHLVVPPHQRRAFLAVQ